MTDKAWKLGDDLYPEDNLLDGITFGELILTVHCNCQTITPQAVQRELRKILEIRKQDMEFLLKKNMDAIMEDARKGQS